jgi:hypothetical protein
MYKVIGETPEDLSMEQEERDSLRQVFIRRDNAGQVTGLLAEASGEQPEIASVTDPDVQQFLRQLDLDLVRVLEDVIDLLVAKGIFRFTDLPAAAQEKLLFRKTVRSQWQAVRSPLSAEDDLL